MSSELTKDQEATLEQFRSRLAEQDLLRDGDTIGSDDFTLLRFLRARQFDVKAATTMWANCLQWRKTVQGVGIDELYKQMDPYDFPERREVFEYWPMWFHKTDKAGRPLSIQHYGGVNMPELYKLITPERFMQYIIVTAESIPREILPAASRAAGRQVEGQYLVVDLKGFSLGQFWQMKNVVRESFQIMQDYFPELMYKFIIINAPVSFTYIWSFVKLWLAKETLAKIDILGADYQNVLLKDIDRENLPVVLGGTCECEDVGGCKWCRAPR
ncbi:CRAL/TRIO domain-containing protein [Wolfiporia cocos MD-104 SS10]|uniref:CRAL/TRIO domain-containing protein n=1 Tax=Wolfiporia cocos (strain MD-104) TaxID=742152 RepID=A0A2H3IYP7_WOLCO|nr:CRAL/TRIO domain-containing protein [Wolfiporia cocos MD-104 SS10]